jgi:predicted enzyme related to lactoylglutathione lyase
VPSTGVGGVIDERTFACTQDGFVELAAWAGGVAPEVRIGIEGSASYGAPLAHHLIAAGFSVREVPPQLSRRERARSRRPGKSDPGDALAIARVTLREPDLPPVRLEDRSTELGLLADARDDLVHAQTRARNLLHAHLVVLLPGYGRTVAQLVSGRQLAAIERALAGSTGVRADLARALLAEVRDLGRRVAELERTIAILVAGHPVLALPGVGVLTAVSDANRSAAFYERYLGAVRDTFDLGRDAVAFVGWPTFALSSVRRPGQPGPSPETTTIQLWWRASDAQALCEEVVADGIRILVEPSDGPFGRTFAVADPDGYRITVYEKDQPMFWPPRMS